MVVVLVLKMLKFPSAINHFIENYIVMNGKTMCCLHVVYKEFCTAHMWMYMTQFDSCKNVKFIQNHIFFIIYAIEKQDLNKAQNPWICGILHHLY
jgi:hypothetical protein